VNMVNRGTLASSSGAGTTDLTADDLKAHFLSSALSTQPTQLDTIMGRGHTVLRQISVDGIDQTSTGDTLDAKFRPRTVAVAAKPTAAQPTQNIGDTILTAVQQGHVVMVRSSPAKGRSGGSVATTGSVAAANDMERARADRAVYDGNSDKMTLTGGAQVTDSGSVLWADQVTLDHATGDAHGMGAVKVNYIQEDASSALPGRGAAGSGQSDPTHVLADRADLDHDTGIAIFHGKPARMWQEGNQVLAPAIEFSRTQKRLIAHGEAGTGWSTAAQAAQVHTVLVQAPSEAPAGGSAGATNQPAACTPNPQGTPQARPVSAKSAGTPPGVQSRTGNVVRIASGGLIYSDIERQADFTGGFRAETAEGTIRASEGMAFMQPRTAQGRVPASGGGPTLAGDLDHLVATGHVELIKPGLQATGERLVYTASDRTALLTGDKDSPPKATDAQGTTTGAALRFRSSCDGNGNGTVEVLGAPGQRVQTDARMANETKKDKGKQ
jgi:lipopolysaccharide export system protein LptA